MMEKRSLTLNGHRTSLALEPAFWSALDEIAKRNGRSLSAEIGVIDRAAAHRNLASAVRCAVLDHYRGLGAAGEGDSGFGPTD